MTEELTISEFLAHLHVFLGPAAAAGQEVMLTAHEVRQLHRAFGTGADLARHQERRAAGDVRGDVLSADDLPDPRPEPVAVAAGNNFRPADPVAAASLMAFARTGGPVSGGVVVQFPRGGGHGRA